MTLRTAPWFVADFDSASAMVQASARFLHGEDFPGLGLSRRLEPLAMAVNYLPRPVRRFIYTYSGGAEAIAPARLSEIRAEEVGRWATGLYPERSFPAIAIGSSNGALVHLCAALGIPWLPQTVLIADRLRTGGTIILVDCRLRWPTTRVGERHFFQFGGFGDASATEYREGGERVRAFLERQKSALRCWEPPHPDTDSPEAEWGFEPALAQDVERLARERGYRLLRLGFEEPDDLAAPVADLHRRWYAENGLPTHRLLVESFVLLDPWLAMRTGQVPFWTTFPIERSAVALERYLDAADPYDEIRVALFAHGMSSIGVAPPKRWRPALARARRHGAFLGTRPSAFPEDFAVFARFNRELRAIPERHPAPDPLPLTAVEAIIAKLATGRRVAQAG
jgi:hypothetical protein